VLPALLAAGHMICTWCQSGRIYDDGTRCQHGEPPVDCKTHGRWTDLNLVARGRRAVIKCTHYGNAWVVLFADPIGDDKEYGTYTLQFAMVGVGQERYVIRSRSHVCPHFVYDKLVAEMRAGARPSQNRVPPIEGDVAEPGKELPNA
jgi:hypothetical protein